MAPDQTRRQKQALAARAPSVIDPADRLSLSASFRRRPRRRSCPSCRRRRPCVRASSHGRGAMSGSSRDDCSSRTAISCLLQEVRGFVDRLLRLRLDGLKDHGPIDACKMVFYWGLRDDDDDALAMDISRAIKSWIRRVLECQVQSLRVDISRDDGSCTPMSNKPLVSQHLTRLELKGLHFLGRNGCLDFSGCPALKHLEVKDCELSDDLTKMASPSVKHLVMADCASLRFHICFPLLVSLCLENFFDYTPVLESMPQLREAYVYTDECYSTTSADIDYEASGQDIIKCVLLEGLAQAKHLVLTSADDKISSSVCYLKD